jgi:hypothetical protein
MPILLRFRNNICSAKRHVRSYPKSGHVQSNSACPLSANRDIDHYFVGNSDPTHDRVIHSVDCFPRLSVMPVFVILKLMSPFA